MSAPPLRGFLRPSPHAAGCRFAIFCLASSCILLLTVGCQTPAPYAGTWDADNSRWSLTFAPDGQLHSFKNNANAVIEVAEQGVEYEGRGGYIVTFFIGECTTEYDPARRYLEVVIPTDFFRIEAPDGRKIEGHKTDLFWGTFSEDFTEWPVQWSDIGQADLLPTEDPNRPPKPLLFRRPAEPNEPAEQ